MRVRSQSAACSLLVAMVSAGCGTTLPARLVHERSVGDLSFRRYQRTLDVEFPITGRTAAGHTATYVHRSEPSPGQLEVRYATAFVTVYSEAASLTAEVREHLFTLGSYEVEPRDFGGGTVLWLDGGSPKDTWAVWVSGPHVVKLGGSLAGDEEALDAFEELADAYISTYPSDLDEHGHARSGTDSHGPSRQQEEERGEFALPRHLRNEAPQE